MLRAEQDKRGLVFLVVFLTLGGGATWRRAWDKYDVEMKEYENMKKAGQLKFLENPPFEGFLGKRLYRLLKTNKLDTWDYPWIFTCIINGGALYYTPSKFNYKLRV